METYSEHNQLDILYALLIGLFLVELVVGFVQLIGALVRTINLINRKQSIGKLKTYWILVGIYFFVFGCLYFAHHLLQSHISNHLSANPEEFFESFKYLNYFMYAYVVWIFVAWLIAIWYWIKIVFVKQKTESV